MARAKHLIWPLLALTASAMAAAIALGYFGEIHPSFDSFAHFRLHMAALLALCGLLLAAARSWRIAGLLAVLTAAACGVTTLLPAAIGFPDAHAARTGPVTGARYRLLQMNLRYDNPTPEKVLSLIGRVSPDVVTLEEVPDRWVEKLKLIEAAYPYRIICPQPSYIGGVAILSRRPFAAGREPACFDRGSLALADIDFGGRVVSVGALHLGWPWPFHQPAQIRAITPALQTALSASAIVAGDFNAVPWSATVRHTAAAGDLAIVRGIGPTWLSRGMPDLVRRLAGLPIDNVLVRGNVTISPPERLSYTGSDHLPVLVEFGIGAEAKGPERMEARLVGE